MPYAFDEFRTLLPRPRTPVSIRDPKLRYACALLAELTYHHVPRFEIDAKKRALMVPCAAYQAIVRAGAATSVAALLQGMDFPNVFVVVDRAVVAIGILVDRVLFIAFRGTSFLFDWKINLRAPLVRVNAAGFYHPFGPTFAEGRVHGGFAEEAVRISVRIIDAILDNKIEDIEHIVLTGHSLGGAVAALSEFLIHRRPVLTCIFGTPRYCDVAAYYAFPFGHPPTQIQRPGDIVPFVPPRRSGYVDHPYPFDTTGEQLVRPTTDSRWLAFPGAAWFFVRSRFKPHWMENYRKDLGRTAEAQFAQELLIEDRRLTQEDTKGPPRRCAFQPRHASETADPSAAPPTPSSATRGSDLPVEDKGFI